MHVLQWIENNNIDKIAEWLSTYNSTVNDYVSSSSMCVTPLIHATMLSSVEIVRLLLAKGADPNIGDKLVNEHDRGMGWDKSTPLHFAAEKGNLEIAKLLIDAGAKTEAKDDCGVTPLMNAVKSGNIALAELLLNNGASVNTLMNSRKHAILFALNDAKAELLSLLIKHGGNVNQQMDGKWTPLLSAVANSQFIIAKLLLQHGADVQAKTEAGWDVHYVAKDKIKLAELLE